MSKIVAIIEARMTSTRLPGKVLLPICSKPILELLIERVRKIPQIDEIVVATTWNNSDDPIHALTRKLSIACYRGSEADVLGRVLGAAKTFEADYIVEITADCPLLDPSTSERCIDEFFSLNMDYGVVSGEEFPSGMEIQIFSTEVLSEVDRQFSDNHSAREHVSLPIYSQPERYKIFQMKAQESEKSSGLRFDLDTPEDLELIKIIFETLYPRNPDFRLLDVLNLLDSKPELKLINAEIKQKHAKL
ncbi:MAG: glycosyltransferase family protein [Mariprofundaceae bacterium]|nr:glycosyltransferase family protein [Mariprofundaceae bacterium]